MDKEEEIRKETIEAINELSPENTETFVEVEKKYLSIVMEEYQKINKEMDIQIKDMGETYSILFISKYEDMNEIYDNVYLIKKGVRSCYLAFPNKDILPAIEKYVKEEGLFIYKDKLTFLNKISLYIYKYETQREIIEFAENITGTNGRVSMWMIGKLLGYSDGEEDKFLREKVKKNEKQ